MKKLLASTALAALIAGQACAAPTQYTGLRPLNSYGQPQDPVPHYCINTDGSYPCSFSIGLPGLDLFNHLPVSMYDATTGLAVDFTTGTAGAPLGGVQSVQGVDGGIAQNVRSKVVDAAISFAPLAGTGTLASGTSDGSSVVSVMYNVLATGASIEVDESPDGSTNWTRVGDLFSAGSQPASTLNTANVLYSAVVPLKYWRVQQTAYASGTTTGFAQVTPTQSYVQAYIANFVNTAYNTAGGGIGVAPVYQNQDVPTTVSANSSGVARMDAPTHGLIIRPYETQVNSWKYVAAASGISNTTTAVSLVAADASRKACLTSFEVNTNGALGTGGEYVIGDGVTSTALFRFFIPAAGLVQPLVYTPPTPICTAAVNTAMVFGALTADVTGAVYANAGGYFTK